MERKLKQKKCKFCKEIFQPQRSLQYLCGPECGWRYGEKLAEKRILKEMKVEAHQKKNKTTLQKEINKLARNIDKKFGITDCIDCGVYMGKQIHGAHYHSVGSNNSLRFNLHNIHSSTSQCNKYSENHKEGYTKGLEKRYGNVYLDYIKNLPLEFPSIKLSSKEIVEKIKIVRHLNRAIDNTILFDPLQARSLYNNIIGIYT